MAELTRARKTMTQATPHSRFPTTKNGFTLEFIRLATWFVPQPAIIPQAESMKNTPMTMMDTIIARGSVFLGLTDSSAIGATDSNPVNAKIANTMARKKPLPLDAAPGLKPDALSPPLPGWIMPLRASATMMAVSERPRMTNARPISLAPWYTRTVIRPAASRKNSHHGKLAPHSACRVALKM